MKVSFTSLEEAWNLKPSSHSSTRSPSSRSLGSGSGSGSSPPGRRSSKKNDKWREYLNRIHRDEDSSVRKHNTNYRYKSSSGSTTNEYDSDSSDDIDVSENMDNFSENSDMTDSSEIDMRLYSNSRQMPQRNYNVQQKAAATATIPPVKRASIEHFGGMGAGIATTAPIDEECSAHLQHFIDCPRCNKMIRERIEAFMNLEKKDEKMMKAMRINGPGQGHGGDPSFYPKIDQGQLYINPGTASPVPISDNTYETVDDEENGEVKENFYGAGSGGGNKWWNYIGEILLLIFIGIMFIYVFDIFVNLGMKWKK